MHSSSADVLFKWVRDAIWINTVDEAQNVVNVLLFNGDDEESIAAVLRFKYKIKISFEAVGIYKNIFFNPENIPADRAVKYCRRMSGSTLILRKISGDGDSAIDMVDSTEGAISRELIFHDSSYIKWKIGYPEVKPPSAEAFLSKVMADASFRYYEAGMTLQFAKVKKEEGTSPVNGGAYENTVVQYDNTATSQAKLMDTYTNMYIRAMRARPTMKTSAAQHLADELTRLNLEFDQPTDSLVQSCDLPDDIMADIIAARSIGGDGADGQSKDVA